MPTYEYICSECAKKFEKFQAMSDEPIRKCPHCKKMSVRRLISGGVGIIFSRYWRDSALAEKGSGFYATDYKKKSPGDKKAMAESSSKSCPSCAPSSKGCSSCKK